MSWRPGGGSGSFRRHGLIDGSTFLRSSHGRSNGRSSDEEGGAGGGGAKPASSFLRIRPISGSGNGGGSGSEAGGSSSGTSRNISSLLRSGDSSSRGATSSSATSSLALPSSSSSVTAPSSRSSSFRLAGAREGGAASERVERSNSWRRSHFSSPVTSYFSSGHSSSDKTKHQVAVAALTLSSTLCVTHL